MFYARVAARRTVVVYMCLRAGTDVEQGRVHSAAPVLAIALIRWDNLASEGEKTWPT